MELLLNARKEHARQLPPGLEDWRPGIKLKRAFGQTGGRMTTPVMAEAFCAADTESFITEI